MSEETENRIASEVTKALRPYFKVTPLYFYTDIVLTALIGWGSFIALALPDQAPFLVLCLLLVSYCAFYRGLALIHEVVHFQKRVKFLALLYNLFFGYPLRIPLYMHTPHRFHHKPSTFATIEDPEYAYLEGKGSKALLQPFVLGLLSPLLLALRFGVIPLLMFVIPKSTYKSILQRYSTIVVNPYFQRSISDKEFVSYRLEDLKCAGFFLVTLIPIASGWVPLRLLGYWYLLMSVGAFVNIWRARIAHRYDNPGKRQLRLEQIRDSVTVESSFLSFLWAPIGLQYHSLHHFAPQIPYYNLRAAHHELRNRYPEFVSYRNTLVPDVKRGLAQFVRTVFKTP